MSVCYGPTAPEENGYDIQINDSETGLQQLHQRKKENRLVGGLGIRDT